MKNQHTKGLLLSYCSTALNLLTGFALTPVLLSALGQEDYSLYKVIQSLAGSLMMFNLGLSTITARAVARQDSRQETDAAFSLAVTASFAAAGMVILLGFGLSRCLPWLFDYSPEQLDTAGKLTLIFSAATAAHIVSDTFRGCAQGKERFSFLHGTACIQHLLRFGGMLLAARNTGLGIVRLALVDFGLYLLLLVLNGCYCRFSLGQRMGKVTLNREALTPFLSFGIAILLQAVTTQISSNLDLVILGAVNAPPRIITAYSSALTVSTVYSSLIMAVSGLYFPEAARLTAGHADGEMLTDFVIRPGRIQAAVALGILSGFALLGRDFIRIWIGPEYEAGYPLTLLLMAAATLSLVQYACVAILDARLKRLFRSCVGLVMAAGNLMLSLLLVKPLGFWGPALGTAISLIGQDILMNRYYSRFLGLNIRRMLREILCGILPAAGLSCLICLPLTLVPERLFFLKCIGFSLVYAFFLWKVGLTSEEKRILAKGVLHGSKRTHPPTADHR